MRHAKPFPEDLRARYRQWQENRLPEKRESLARLAHGQTPQTMFIACCDSRVMLSNLFSAEAGDFFTHRNIAALVPPRETDGLRHGTSAAIEYAVTTLKVRHLVVMGHSGCGGVAGCHDLLAGTAPQLEGPESFVGNWLRILQPGYDAVRGLPTREERVAALERQAILVSLENLMSFPFVAEAVTAGTLELHGAWKNIGGGVIEWYDAASGSFVPL